MSSEQSNNKRRNASAYLKYSGIAFQMAIILLIGVQIGSWLDEKYQLERPYGTLICVLVALVAAFYITLKDLLVPPKK